MSWILCENAVGHRCGMQVNTERLIHTLQIATGHFKGLQTYLCKQDEHSEVGTRTLLFWYVQPTGSTGTMKLLQNIKPTLQPLLVWCL